MLGLFALAVYTVTLHPSVPGGDSGELIVAAHTFGISHPPGYPLHALLGHLFTWLPFGSIGWRVNFLSAVCDAGAVTLLALAVAEWAGLAGAGLLAGGLFAFSPGIWNYAVVTEVFALNNLLVAALLYVSVRFAREPRCRWALLAAFIIGLGIANHHTLLLYALPLVLWALWFGGGMLRAPRMLLLLVLACLLGTLPYLYLPIATAHCPPLFWGNTTTWEGFLHHLLRRHVGTLRLAASDFGPPVPLVQQTHQFMAFLIGQTLFLGVPFAIAGQASSCLGSGNRSFGFAILAAFYCYFFVFHGGANLPVDSPFFLGVQERFWQQPCMLVCAWIGLGAALLLRRRPQTLVATALILTLIQTCLHFRPMDQHRNDYIDQYARSVLAPLPPGALLLLSGDMNANATWYVQHCDGFRKDVMAVDISRLTWPWAKQWMACRFPRIRIPGDQYVPGKPGAYNMGTFVAANIGLHPIHIRGSPLAHDQSLDRNFQLWPDGLTTAIVAKSTTLDLDHWLKISEAHLPRGPIPPLDHYPPSTWEFALRDAPLAARQDRAQRILTEAIARKNDRKLLGLARDEFEAILPHFDSVPPQTYKNLGAVYSRLVPLTPRLQQRMLDLLQTYVETGPRTDEDLVAIEKMLKALPTAIPRPRNLEKSGHRSH